MKRETDRVQVDPKAIGAAVRDRLERTLVAPGFAPPTSRFLDRMQILAELLALWGARTNLTARPGDPAETAFHILDSLTPLALADRAENGATRQLLGDKLGKGRRVIDIGSGAGFPGLVLAAASDAHFTLSESRRKRSSFLSVAVAEMGLDNAVVESMRADVEDLTGAYDAMTARAIGSWPSLWQIAAAALRPGGIAILYVGPDQPLDMDLARASGFASCQRTPYNVNRDGDSQVQLSVDRDLIVAIRS